MEGIIMSEAIKNRYDFVVIYDVENGNPNGDPDAGNMPRVDAETGYGIVTDVCIKRKIRNYIQLVKEDSLGNRIFIKEILNQKLEEAYTALNISKKAKEPEKIKAAQKWMCENYYDVRAFGAVMSTGDCSCGTVRGPIQLNFGKSVEPVMPQEMTITRMAITNPKDASKGETEMGKKSYIPYGLYRTEGFISAKLAQDVTGFSEDDLALFWEALINMFEHDRSAARGKMIVRKLVVFKHECVLGNAQSHKLFERVTITKKDPDAPAIDFNDYEINVDKDDLPDGISIEIMVD